MANHLGRTAAKLPDPTPEPDAPKITWLALVRAGEDDYRVCTRTTRGVPADAVVGAHSASLDEAEERAKIELADMFDSVDLSYLGLELPEPPADRPPRQNELDREHNRALEMVAAQLVRMRRGV